jgi:hypothetical protein
MEALGDMQAAPTLAYLLALSRSGTDTALETSRLQGTTSIEYSDIAQATHGIYGFDGCKSGCVHLTYYARIGLCSIVYGPSMDADRVRHGFPSIMIKTDHFMGRCTPMVLCAGRHRVVEGIHLAP